MQPTNDDPQNPAGQPGNQATDEPSGAKPLATAIDDNKQPKSKPNRRRWLILAAGLILLVGAFAAGQLLRSKDQPRRTSQTAKLLAVKPKTIAVSPTGLLETVTPLAAAPELFKSPLDYFGKTCDNGDCNKGHAIYTSSDVSYYKLGTTEQGKTIIAAAIGQAMERQEFIAIEQSNGGYAVLAQYLAGFASPNEYTGQADYVKNLQAALAPKNSVDTTTQLAELNFPKNLKVNGQAFSVGYSGALPYLLPGGLSSIRGSYFGAVTTDNVRLVTTQNGQIIYNVTARTSSNFSIQEIYSSYKALYAQSYRLVDPLVTDSDQKPAINWQSGDTSVQANYTNRPVGCGSANGFVVAKNLTIGQLSVAGSGPGGQTLYDLPLGSALLSEIYTDDYANGDGVYTGDATKDASLKNLTISQFRDVHGAFLTQNAMGDLVVYLRSDMINGGGCGKPVIYLYPKTPTSVNVKVGADVTKSVPAYPAATGWQNVRAQPNGQLRYQGKPYGSLFWEGLGFGPYPALSTATVVRRDQAVTTIRAQLKAQGLNTTEINDFMAFWQPRLPRTAYISLSWLSSEQLDSLAPLSIQPRPNTVIRVFLDFKGVNQPQSKLPAPTFSAPARTGFTVVEWGGLLSD